MIDSCLFQVFPEDSGTYMVVASNLAGETKCLADLIVEEDKSPEEEKRIFYQEFSSVQQTKQVRYVYAFPRIFE